MDLVFDIVLLILGFVLGFLANWYFYRKERKESKANAEFMKQIRQYVGAVIRLGNDKRGKIVERPDGTIAIDWRVTLSETLSISDKVSTKKKTK